MSETEWLDDCVAVCLNKHMVKEVRIVWVGRGMYQKMCRECFLKQWPNENYEELERA